jgi:salicylate hydroxylase
MSEASLALGDYRTSTRFMYNGPNAHAITYPVAMGNLLNVLLVIYDPKPWDSPGGKHTSQGSKAEALEAFKEWHPTMRALVDLLPEQMDKWAIFDMLDSPAPSYSQGRVCIAGDAAHAAGPHLGAGAGFGMEDALVLSALLQAVDRQPFDLDRTELSRAALAIYSDVRHSRAQWLAPITREACDLFQWRYPSVRDDYQEFAKEITWRFHDIWDYDVDEMAQRAVEKLDTWAALRTKSKDGHSPEIEKAV